MSVRVEATVVEQLLTLLRTYLPAETTAVNATRKAKLVSTARTSITLADPGRFVWSTTTKGASDYSTLLAPGVWAVADLVALINAEQSIAAEDERGRLVLTSPTAPAVGVESVVSFLGGTSLTEGPLTALGWDSSGQTDVRSALAGPGWAGVMDGYPQVLDPLAMQPGAFIVVVGDRTAKPVSPDIRVDQYEVTVDLTIWRAEAASLLHRNREPIHAALQAVRQVLFTDVGRYVDGQAVGILRVRETRSRVEATPLRSKDAPNRLLDLATMQLVVTIHERPSSTFS